jgi:transcriptional regulator with XRE-family HTH domain
LVDVLFWLTGTHAMIEVIEAVESLYLSIGGHADMTDSMARSPLHTSFAATLFQLRDARGWSQQEVAERLGVSTNTVSRWERGEIARPDPIHRRRLAELFDVTVEQLRLTRPDQSRHMPQPADADAMEGSSSLPLLAALPGNLAVVSDTQQAFRATRRALNTHRFLLSNIGSRLYRSPKIGQRLLTLPGWLPQTPIQLDRLSLCWVDQPALTRVTGAELEASRLLPYCISGQRYHRYTHALRDLNPPKLLENRSSYRLLDINLPEGNATLTFGPTTYFELLDIAEALAHELAATHLIPELASEPIPRPPSWRQLALRRLVGDPFDLFRRPVPCSVDTLTIRRDRQGDPSVILHQRNADQVAVCGSMYHVMPAGVFQPCTMTSVAHVADGDLWRNILREYAEEFLGDLDYDGNATNVFDYNLLEPLRILEQARQDGMLHVWFLGAGLDPLTLWGELLTVVVINSDVFDEAFYKLVPANIEGTVVQVANRNTHGVPFTYERLEQLREAPMAPAAVACLELAWRHRHFLEW